VYAVFVIVWGAYVRASGSGAGCGSHWPLCNGTAIPSSPSTATLIEFSHRLTSGLSLIFVVALFFLVRRVTNRGSAFRRAAGWSLLFILAEAAVGAMLVLQRLVAEDSSLARAVVISMHLVNTMFLTAAIAWTALEASHATEGGESIPDRFSKFFPESASVPEARTRAVLKYILYTGAGFLLVGASGAIVALGDTLFPAGSLMEGLAQDLSPGSHFLIRLRVIHPLIAIALAVVLWWQLRAVDSISVTGGLTSNTAFLVRFFLLLQLVVGIVNWLLLAPHWLQLLHLAVANALWISLVSLVFALNRVAKSAALH
jgi:heme A synthase